MGSAFSNNADAKKPVLVIVGSGYAGAALAASLDSTFFIILIDRMEYKNHKIAALRAMADPSVASDILVPNHNLLKNGVFVQAQVENILSDHVVVQGGVRIPFDYLVIATGSAYAWPNAISETTKAKALPKYQIVNSSIKSADSILIVGGGAVGIELAGEIATEFPTKSVTLVHSGQNLAGEGFQPKFYSNIDRLLSELRVKVIKGERLNVPDHVTEAMKQKGVYYYDQPITFTTATGTALTSSLTFFATGTTINQMPLKNFESVLTSNGLQVNDNFSVGTNRNVFAIGDAAAKEGKMALRAGNQAKWLASYLKAKVQGKEGKIKPYEVIPPALFMSIGRHRGVGEMGGSVMPSFIVTMIKSKDMFTGKQWGEMRLKRGAGVSHDGAEQKRFKLKQHTNLSDEQINKLVMGDVQDEPTTKRTVDETICHLIN